MYSEQMMREQGFDDAPNFRLNMHTDAIWRACRIILDVRMHRGEIERRGGDPSSSSTRRASRRRTPGPRSAATPTRRPTSCRTCSARSSCSSSAPTSRRASAIAFSLRDFHDTLLRNGSLPISFHRRLLRERLAGAADASTPAPAGAARAARPP